MTEDRGTAQRLIYDVGFNNGNDTAYYLAKGFRVVAVEADTKLAKEGSARFATEIAAGRLTIVNSAVWERSDETISFFINDDPGHSSINAPREGGGNAREISVGTVSMPDLISKYGVPWYLKIDIEGADEMAVRSLAAVPDVPKYLSFEIGHGCDGVGILSPLGYTGFKLINPESLTQNLPIFDHEFRLRCLRKPSVLSPRFRSLVASLPDGIRPEKILWDTFRDTAGETFQPGTTGPFAEETAGEWKTAKQMAEWLKRVYLEYDRAGWSGWFWYDLHAKHATADRTKSPQ